MTLQVELNAHKIVREQLINVRSKVFLTAKPYLNICNEQITIP